MSIGVAALAFAAGDLDEATAQSLKAYHESPSEDLAELLDALGALTLAKRGGWGESGKALVARFGERIPVAEVPAAAAALYRLPGTAAAEVLAKIHAEGDPRWVTGLGPILHDTTLTRPAVIEGVRHVWEGVVDVRKRAWLERTRYAGPSRAWTRTRAAIVDRAARDYSPALPELDVVKAFADQVEKALAAETARFREAADHVKAGDRSTLRVRAEEWVESGAAFGELVSLQLVDVREPLRGTRRTRMKFLINALAPAIAPGLVGTVRNLGFREGLPWSGTIARSWSPALPSLDEEPMLRLLGDVKVIGRHFDGVRAALPWLQPHPDETNRLVDPVRFTPPEPVKVEVVDARLEMALAPVELHDVDPGEAVLWADTDPSAVRSALATLPWTEEPEVCVLPPRGVRVSVIPEPTRLERKHVRRDVWALVALATQLDASCTIEDGTPVLAAFGHRLESADSAEHGLQAALYASGLPKKRLVRPPRGTATPPEVPRPRFDQRPYSMEDGVEWRIQGMPHARFYVDGSMQVAIWGHDFPGESTKSFGERIGGPGRWVRFESDDLYWLGRSAEHTRRVLQRLRSLCLSSSTHAAVVGAYRGERMSDAAIREVLALGPLGASPFWDLVDLWRVTICAGTALLLQGRSRLRQLLDPDHPRRDQTWHWYDLDIE